MRTRSFARLSCALCLVGGVLLTTRAQGATNDVAALALHTAAMGDDYLRTDFAAAEQKLLRALSMCGGDACTRRTLARLQVDLGTVAFAREQTDSARAHFAAALQYDRGAALDADLASTELRAVFDEVRASAPAASSPMASPRPASDAPGGEPPVSAPAAVAAAPSGAGNADCPPEFPGCEAKGALAAPTCGDAGACGPGTSCDAGVCAAATSPAAHRRNWVSLAFQQDVVALSSATDACAGGSGYTCFRQDGGYYADVPLRGADNAVGGGFAPATRRVLVGYDRTLGEHFSAGARLGFAFGGGPERPGGGSFLPLHAELRAAYWFGHEPHARVGLRPFVLVAGGAAEVDASVKVNVYADANAYDRGNGESVLAWKKTGRAFGALGAGAMLALAPSSGITLECRAMEMLPTATTAVGVQLGYVVGM